MPARSNVLPPGESPQSGFTLVEIAFAVSILASAAVAFLGALVTSQMVAKQTRETNTANVALVNAVETFRERSAMDFPKALDDYIQGVRKPDLPKVFGNHAELKAQIVLDETKIDPPVDLNGDGDFEDTSLSPTALRAVVLRLELNWLNGNRRRAMTQTAVLSRSELEQLYAQQKKEPPPDETPQGDPLTISDFELAIIPYAEAGALTSTAARAELKDYLTLLVNLPKLQKNIKDATNTTLKALQNLGSSQTAKKLSAVTTALDALLLLLDQ